MDNEEESRSLASLLNRTYLDEETSILTYINLLVGNYDKETGIFHDDQGREYPTIDSEEASYGQNPYIAGNIINIDKAYRIIWFVGSLFIIFSSYSFFHHF